MNNFSNAYAPIVKYDKNGDGTLMVYGKATDDSLDIDQQICDAGWLDRAMPEWFKSGGNIREQHSTIAAGVAKEYESKEDGHYITTLVVDPVSVKKVETGVLKGFSIGIKSPRVVRDTKAVNGRIIDGQIVEVSLVDRPANPNAKLIMAKSVEGESSLIQVEELHEYKAPLPSEVIKATEKGSEMDTLTKSDVVEIATEAEVIETETEKSETVDKCLECGCDVPTDLHGKDQVVIAGGQVANVSTSQTLDTDGSHKSAEGEEVTAEEIPAEVPAEEVKAEEEVSTEEPIEVLAEEKTLLGDSQVAEILEKAVKSAKESVQTEIDLIKSEKLAAENKVLELEAELAVAVTKAVAGGPKRSAIKAGSENENNVLLAKADDYVRKAATTTDPDLASGYRALAKEFFAKAGKSSDSE